MNFSFVWVKKMWFIASLIAAVAAVWFYDKVERFSEELAIALLALAILSLVFSLFSAPWQIQLLLLAGTLSYRSTKVQSTR
ncbi:hypothetical protein [Leptolyngbya sp. FACHB-671]|uniref:hypothetical protein n=1 Tax=Leptolyngbya sp. FACHB-671 TaxID=2692812 RepID=UPI0016869E25|nr:hypothetical protein [Leptolyngbya sp. FACHB-671]